MERWQRWIRRWAVFFFLGTLFWSASVFPQQPLLRGRLDDQAPATAQTGVRVPNLIGSRVPQAQARLEDPDLGLKLGGVANRVAPQPPGTIVDQTPGAGTMVRRGTQVNVWVAVPVPVQNVRVPNLIGSRVPQARARLEDPDIGLKLGGVANRGDPRPPGTIVDQTPAAGQMVPRGTPVNIWVAVEGPPRVPEEQKFLVPPVVNMKEDHARQDIRDSKLQVGQVTRIKHDRPAGIVVQQSPAAGTQVRRGSSVDLWVSLGRGEPGPGEKKFLVPPVVNMLEDHARQDIRDSQLRVGQVTRIRHDRSAGIVVQQSPAAGTRVGRGSSVDLVVSLGRPEPPPPPPKQVQVPDLSRNTTRAARELLENRGLLLGRQEEQINASYPEGTIMRQEPEAGERVEPDTRVNVWIARRPTPPPLAPPQESPLIPLLLWLGGGSLSLLMGYGIYRIIKPAPRPKPVSLEAKATLEEGRFEAAWEGGKQTGLELRLRARSDLGTQDLEAPGPLVKGERREHE